MKILNSIIALIVSIGTAMIGYNVNVAANSSFPLFWSICDFFLWPLAWIKWLVCQQINLTIIKHTFSFFFN